MQFKPEDRLILSGIKINPTAGDLEKINSLIPQIRNWNYLVKNVIDRGIAPLLYKKLPLLTNSSLIPEPVRIKLQQAYYITFNRSSILHEHFRKIAEQFTQQNIPVIALKGIYLSEWLYHDIGLRQFSDIDLLVKDEDASTCLAILEAMGYRHSGNPRIEISEFIDAQLKLYEKTVEFAHYEPEILNGVSVEIHIKLFTESEGYDLNLDEIWKNAIPTVLNGIPVFTLGTYDLLIYLCLHLDKHFRQGRVQFTCFNDITNLLVKYSDTLDWAIFTETCRKYKCVDIVFPYFVLVHKYMNISVPDYIITKYGSLLTDSYENIFYRNLKGCACFISTRSVSVHLESLKHLSGFPDKTKYVLKVFFPPKTYMVQKYDIKPGSSVMVYYLYRFYIGVKKILFYIKR